MGAQDVSPGVLCRKDGVLRSRVILPCCRAIICSVSSPSSVCAAAIPSFPKTAAKFDASAAVQP